MKIAIAFLALSCPAQQAILKYSVHPGGFGSADELRAAIYEPSLSGHYAVLGSRVHEALMPEDRAMYVSYLNDSFYWTASKLLIRKGRPIFTDGSHIVLQGCGNRAEDTPQGPTQPFIPPAVAERILTEVTYVQPPEMPPPAVTEIWSPELPGWSEPHSGKPPVPEAKSPWPKDWHYPVPPAPPYYPPYGHNPPPPPLARTPEPGTLLTTAAGFMMIALGLRARR